MESQREHWHHMQQGIPEQAGGGAQAGQLRGQGARARRGGERAPTLAACTSWRSVFVSIVFRDVPSSACGARRGASGQDVRRGVLEQKAACQASKAPLPAQLATV